MQFFMLIPNMTFVLTERVAIKREIEEYWPKNAIFAYSDQVGLGFGHVRSFISKQIIYDFVAREKLYRMI